MLRLFVYFFHKVLSARESLLEAKMIRITDLTFMNFIKKPGMCIKSCAMRIRLFICRLMVKWWTKN